MDDGHKGVVNCRMRVGITIPGRVAASWPLIRLESGTDGIYLASSPLIRRIVAGAVGKSLRSGARAPQVPWAAVAHLRRIGLGVEFRLTSGELLRVFPFLPRRIERLVAAAVQRGVAVRG